MLFWRSGNYISTSLSDFLDDRNIGKKVKAMKDKKIFSLVLICMLIVSIIFSGTDVSAARKAGLRVTYKGKTVTLLKTPQDSHKNTVSLKAVQKAWGKCKTKKVYKTTTCTWKTKKTKIEISDALANPGNVCGIHISIEDKNGSVSGVKAGMTKAKAFKRLKKTFGAKHVKMQKIENGDLIVIDGMGLYNYVVKSGKVTRINYFGS